MSATITPSPTVVEPPPLVSSSPANQSTAAASSATAAAIVIILLWVITLVHVTVPPEVSAALVTLIGTLVHWCVIKYGLPATT